MIDLQNYLAKEILYEGLKTIVYRGVRKKDGLPVILKALRHEYPLPEDVARLRREFEITRDLPLAGVVKNLEMFEHKNSLVLVQEDFGGLALKLLLQSQKLAVENFLAIAVPLAETLGHLHQRNIIHKDVNPANIIINPKTRQAKLTDFGLASLLPKENLAQWNRLEGTLAYISPEQTGRMNRSIDYRTDLYSLGVTFYEMLTGQLPFAAHDPLELVHSHIAKIPPSPSALDSQIPPALAGIIMKLLAKTAEERYQSGFGLQADLEKCREQWQRDGRIEIFTLGQADFSERFQIPEKLYGREEEIAALLAVFEAVMQGRREILLVTGHPGIGKSSLVHEVHKSLVRERGYFVAGKFDQYQRNVPFASLIQAFQDLVRQLLTESEAQLQYWRERMQAALGVNGKVIAAVIPEIELIIGEQPPVPELSPVEAQNRFKLVFQNFMTALPAKAHPLVIFLDDLQWADSASLQLLQYLIITEASPYFFGIGAYRDNEVGPAHSLTLALEAIEKTGVALHRLSVRPLHLAHVSHLIADTLRCPPETAQPLAQLVLEKTAGNPFFVTQFLKSLHEEKLLAPDAAVAGWRWDLEQIRQRNITDNVVELMAGKVQKLNVATQQSLKLAACIGGQFDLQTLAVVAEKPSKVIVVELAEALAEGLIILISDSGFSDGSAALTTSFGSDKHNDSAKSPSALSPPPSAIYKFAHDRVHQAVYSLIAEADKNPLHRRLGQLLLHNTPESKREQRIFDIVNHLNLGAELIDSETERITLAQLNLRAGHKAKLSTAYEPAFNYLQAGLDLLREDDWDKQYDLALGLHIEAAEAAYLSGNFAAMEKLVEAVLQRAKTLLDQVKVYEVKLESYIARRKLKEVIATALPVMRKLGLHYPAKPAMLHVVISLLKVKLALAGKRIESLSELPAMADPLKQAAMRLSIRVGTASYFVQPELFPLTALEPVRVFLKHGNTPISAYIYAGYGIILCGKLGEIEAGYRFAQLGVRLVDLFDEREFKCRIVFIFNCLIRHWQEHARKTLPAFLEAYQYGLDVGDLEYAALSMFHHFHYGFLCGVELAALEGEWEKFDHAIDPLKQETIRQVKNICHQMVLNLMGKSAEPCRLRGEAYDEERGLAEHLAANDRFALFDLHFYKSILNYLFEDYRGSLENAALAKKYLEALGAIVIPIAKFYESLAGLAIYGEAEKKEQKLILKKTAAHQKKMKKWAKHAPMNHLHRYELVEAERCRVRDDELKAMAFYDRAIASAKKNQYLQDEALANELAAKFYLARGQGKIAKTYMTEARYLYHKWGAMAKVKALEEKHRELLRETAAPSEAARLTSRATVSASGTSSTSAAGALDFLSVLKASQTISGEIDLEKLLAKLIKIVIENAGGQRGFLLLEKAGEMVIEAEGAAESDEVRVLESLPMEKTPAHLATAIVNYVKRTRENVVLGDAAQEGQFAADAYLTSHQVKSVLCQPILKQGVLIGILYLENNLTANAFTPERLEVLNILSAQIAVSLENAKLYHETKRLYADLEKAARELEEYNRTLEQRVAQRTEELQAKNTELAGTLRQLKDTQNQLVMQEKLASLGQLTAGIAHEIKNPLNFVNNFAVLSVDLAKELNEVLEANQDKKVAEIVAEIGEILADLKLNAEKINHHGKRADGIVRSMLQLSRGKAGERQEIDINTLLEESVNLVYHGFRANDSAFNITIEKELDPAAGQIEVVPEDISRVFLNLLNNACYAVQQKRKDNTGKPDGFSPTLSVRTQNLGDKIEIRIRDNGNGIPLDIREKIFNPFFTTKPTGQGTGLGLSISYDIIVQEHRGEIKMETEEGKFTEFIVRLPKDGSKN